ncbi:transketolase C-terminal domain-containing protein [Parapedobacter koreensis]|uniref:Transketolase n=1 Tax=Parapedobacter koreensis TaxID=332977 RepID=A0A1H7L1K3_9SPHI|nr:transketolase C-terminal domain-containing protein [Parapedobacter koreensis]SEK92868.1 Transketolase [Parapedobacter koreensis]
MISLVAKKSQLAKGLVRLLEIKDADIRLSNLYQCRYAVDQAIHIGGASSAVIPMVSVYYSGVLDSDVAQPTAPDQDLFILSKGHAVATLASIYADLGYFADTVLQNSRSISSILNGHPGPILPGVHLATGPMGQGMGVAQGFAIAGQRSGNFDVYALTGDGELQEGPIWETVMYAGYKRLENLCVLVDHNGGQLDTTAKLHFPYTHLAASFQSFGWRVIEVDATQYHGVVNALYTFKFGRRDGRPTVIICNATKGQGGYSDYMNNHKVSIAANLLDQEEKLLQQRRLNHIRRFGQYFQRLQNERLSDVCEALEQYADRLGYVYSSTETAARLFLEKKPVTVKTVKAPIREKRIRFDAASLPKLEMGANYMPHKVIEMVMKVFAKDDKVVSVDADLSSTSGLQAGVGYVDQTRALNVGVAEANMMLIGEAFAILGGNVWISTFCPFYDWKVLRRIAVGYQERLEAIAANSWLSEGHGIDLTLVATAADLETQSNGATHMGNDDAVMLDGLAHLKIINASCPQQLLGILRWIAQGNKGIVYLRILRAAAPVIYASDFEFEYGRSYVVKDAAEPDITVVSSGRQVFESLVAADELAARGIAVKVIDMPSIDQQVLLAEYHSGRPIVIAEQNNGYIWNNFIKVLFENEKQVDTGQLYAVNTVGKGPLQYIHSGTYAELADYYGLSGSRLSDYLIDLLNKN